MASGCGTGRIGSSVVRQAACPFAWSSGTSSLIEEPCLLHPRSAKELSASHAWKEAAPHRGNGAQSIVLGSGAQNTMPNRHCKEA